MPAPHGKSNNYPRSVMQRLGAQPARSIVEPVGGQGPQKLVTEFGNAIAAGEADVVMIIGSEPGSTFRHFAKRDDKPDFTEHSSPVERSAEEIATVTDENRMICDPYTRLLVARDQVNQGAAAVMMSVDAARRLGVPEEKWVFVHGHSDMVEQGLLERADLSASPATVHAAQEALRIAEIGVDDIATFDLYSFFPFPVFVMCEALGIDGDDPRGLTLTGGLPYFGGPGNSYSLHAIAETVAEMRDKAGQFGLVGANGGTMSKYSVGIHSTLPVDWRSDRSAARNDEVAALPTVSVTERADGPATIETYSVR